MIKYTRVRGAFALACLLSLVSPAAPAATYGKASGSSGSSLGSGSFGSDTIIQGTNQVGSTVNSLELVSSLPVNTAGNETSAWKGTSLLNGVPLIENFTGLNGAGLQSVTTSGSTPTVAVNPRSDLLKVTLGADATTLTITGLDLDNDGCYEMWGVMVAPAAAVNVSLNGAGNTGGQVEGLFFSGAGAITTIAQNTLLLADNAAANVYPKGTLCATAVGGAKIWQSQQMRENSLLELYAGRSTITTNVTSVVLNNLKTASVLFFRRVRTSAN